jgi:hypothetical protein
MYHKRRRTTKGCVIVYNKISTRRTENTIRGINVSSIRQRRGSRDMWCNIGGGSCVESGQTGRRRRLIHRWILEWGRRGIMVDILAAGECHGSVPRKLSTSIETCVRTNEMPAEVGDSTR